MKAIKLITLAVSVVVCSITSASEGFWTYFNPSLSYQNLIQSVHSKQNHSVQEAAKPMITPNQMMAFLPAMKGPTIAPTRIGQIASFTTPNVEVCDPLIRAEVNNPIETRYIQAGLIHKSSLGRTPASINSIDDSKKPRKFESVNVENPNSGPAPSRSQNLPDGLSLPVEKLEPNSIERRIANHSVHIVAKVRDEQTGQLVEGVCSGSIVAAENGGKSNLIATNKHCTDGPGSVITIYPRYEASSDGGPVQKGDPIECKVIIAKRESENGQDTAIADCGNSMPEGKDLGSTFGSVEMCSENPKVGDDIILGHHTAGYSKMVSKGKVEEYVQRSGGKVIRHTANMNGGASGGSINRVWEENGEYKYCLAGLNFEKSSAGPAPSPHQYQSPYQFNPYQVNSPYQLANLQNLSRPEMASSFFPSSLYNGAYSMAGGCPGGGCGGNQFYSLYSQPQFMQPIQPYYSQLSSPYMNGGFNSFYGGYGIYDPYSAGGYGGFFSQLFGGAQGGWAGIDYGGYGGLGGHGGYGGHDFRPIQPHYANPGAPYFSGPMDPHQGQPYGGGGGQHIDFGQIPFDQGQPFAESPNPGPGQNPGPAPRGGPGKGHGGAKDVADGPSQENFAVPVENMKHLFAETNEGQRLAQILDIEGAPNNNGNRLTNNRMYASVSQDKPYITTAFNKRKCQGHYNTQEQREYVDINGEQNPIINSEGQLRN